MRSAMILTPFLLLAGCNLAGGHDREMRDAGPMDKRGFAVAGDFNRVSLGGSPDVVVTVGGAPSIRAEGPKKLLDELEIENRGGDLHIGYRKHDGWSFGSHGNVIVYVTAPSLAGAAIGGSGDMRIDKVEGGAFAGSIGGSGDMTIGAMKVGEATFSLAGSGSIRAAGAADKATMSIAGSGDIDLSAVQSSTATVSIVGSGDVRGHVTGTADVSVMGSGDVEISGGGKCNVHKMGSGDVRCAG